MNQLPKRYFLLRDTDVQHWLDLIENALPTGNINELTEQLTKVLNSDIYIASDVASDLIDMGWLSEPEVEQDLSE